MSVHHPREKYTDGKILMGSPRLWGREGRETDTILPFLCKAPRG